MRSYGNQLATVEEDPPTPEPASAIVQVGVEGIAENQRSDLFVQYMMDPPAEDIVNIDALVEAGDLYEDDHERALADLLAGRHPLQRSNSTAD